MKKRLIGLDFGLKRIGVAISDELGWFAHPLLLFECKRKTEVTISDLLLLLNEKAKTERFIIDKVVIGMPLKMSGERSFITDEVDHFIKVWQSLSSIPIVGWDERLTSMQAERMLKEEADLTRKQRKPTVDKVAAAIILQNYLDAQKEIL